MMLNKIKEMQNAIGADKIEVIKKYPELKKVLLYAYDPFKKYYMAAPIVRTTGFCNLGLATESLLDDLSSRKLSGQLAYEAVCDHIASLNPKAAEVFSRIINKDLRAGIHVKSINKAFPGLIPLTWDGSEKPSVMLLKNFDPSRIKYPCLAAIKKDGVRGLYGGEMVSRQGHKLIGHDHIEEELEQYPQQFDGEICVPGEIFDVASGMIRDKNPTPESVYWIFDCPSLPVPKKQRWCWLRVNLEQSANIRLIEHYKFDTPYALMKFYDFALSQGEEGIVVYDPEDLYEDKKSHSWMRLVPVKSADCEVIGFYEGKGKHVNSLGGIEVNYKGHVVRVGTGFSEKIKKSELKQIVKESDKKLLTFDKIELGKGSIGEVSPILQKIRKFIWNNQEHFLGAIAKCEFKEETKAGSMRQPRFKTWRWDK